MVCFIYLCCLLLCVSYDRCVDCDFRVLTVLWPSHVLYIFVERSSVAVFKALYKCVILRCR